MSEDDWEKDRKKLLLQLRDARQQALESQAEAALYREMLEDWHAVAGKAEAQRDFTLLHAINDRIVPFCLPTAHEGKEWSKSFLHAYSRDARWLTHAKQALERIGAAAEKITDDSEVNAQLKKTIIEAVKDGLITHV